MNSKIILLGGTMGRKTAFALGLSLLLCAGASAQGTTSFELLRSEVSSRGASMAGAMTAMNTGVDGIYYNPASLGLMENHQTDISYLKHLLDIESGFLVYGQPVSKYGGFAAGINYINYGVFEEATAYGELTGVKFRANDLLFMGGWGKKVTDRISVGLTGKYIRSAIYDQTASAVAFDAGCLLITPFDSAKVGIVVTNIGKAVDGYYEVKEKLPLSYRIGASKKLAHLPMEIALQAEKFTDSDLYLSAGGEFTISEIIKLRLGWSDRGADQKIGADNDFLAGFSAGFGLYVSGVYLDMSAGSWGELGTMKRFTIGGEF